MPFKDKLMRKLLQKRLDRKLFQKKFDQKRLGTENDIAA